MKRALSSIFAQSLTHSPTATSLSSVLGLEPSTVERLLHSLSLLSLVHVSANGTARLTPSGRGKLRVVLTGGVFDIIHSGHVYTLMKAKALGDVLVVSVARDATVLSLRGKPSINNENERATLVGSVRYVDAAVLGSTTDPLGSLWDVKPDIVAIGYDQKYDEKDLIQKASSRGLAITVKRLDSPIPDIKSSDIKKNHGIMSHF